MRVPLIWFCLVLTCLCRAQEVPDPVTERLMHELLVAGTGADSLRLMADFLDSPIASDHERRTYLDWARRRYDVAMRVGDRSQVAAAQVSLGETLRHTGESRESALVLKSALDYYDRYPDTARLERALTALANIHIINGDTKAAYRSKEQVLGLMRGRHHADSLEIGAQLNAVGYLAVYANKINEATQYLEEARKIARRHPETELHFTNRMHQALLFAVDNRLDEAIDVLKAAVEDPTIFRTAQSESRAYYSLAHYYREAGQIDLANRFVHRVLDDFEPASNFTFYLHLYQNLADGYYQLGKADSFGIVLDTVRALLSRHPEYTGRFGTLDMLQYDAQEAILDGDPEKGRRLYERITDSLDQLNSPVGYVTLYRQAYREMKRLGFYEDALAYHESVAALEDSILNRETRQELAQLQTQYATQEKDAQILLQESHLSASKRQNLYLFLLVGLLLATLLFTFLTLHQRLRLNKLLLAQKRELEKLDAVKSRFFTNITHELRTPLSLILAPLDHALEFTKSGRAKKQIELARANARRLLSLVNEMLDLSKLESGEMRIEATAIHLQDVLRRVFFSFHSIANVRGVMLSFQYHLPEELWVEVDLPKFEKILVNLISNAIKYSPYGGTVILKAIPSAAGGMRIEIEDAGRGISPEDQKRIFDRFYQVDNPELPLQGGTGIGLALAKELAMVLDGKLSVDSAIGQGATFAIELPIHKVGAPARDMSAAVDSAATTVPAAASYDHERAYSYASVAFTDRRPSILIVEDNPEMSNFLKDMLGADYLCSVARNGIEGLKKLSQSSYDLIISDLMMPLMDGFAMREEVLHDRRLRDTPFIFLTARSLSEDKIRGLRLGVDDYITKPFNARELIVRVDNLIQNATQRKVVAERESPEVATGQPSADEERLHRIEKLIDEHLADRTFGVDQLADRMAYSRRQLTRIIKAKTGLTPAKLIQEIRLQHAYRCLQRREFHTIAEIGLSVGYEDPSYFAKVFNKRFGKQPREVFATV